MLSAYACVLLVMSSVSWKGSARARVHFFHVALAFFLAYLSLLASSVPGVCVLFGRVGVFPFAAGLSLALLFLEMLVSAACADDLWGHQESTWAGAFVAMLCAMTSAVGRRQGVFLGQLAGFGGLGVCVIVGAHELALTATGGSRVLAPLRLVRVLAVGGGAVLANATLLWSGGVAPVAMLASGGAILHEVGAMVWPGGGGSKEREGQPEGPEAASLLEEDGADAGADGGSAPSAPPAGVVFSQEGGVFAGGRSTAGAGLVLRGLLSGGPRAKMA